MFAKSVKTIGFTAMIVGLVACGKNKNNLKIDGTYAEEPTTTISQDGKTQITSLETIIDIKDNVQTTYTFSKDKQAVRITKTQLVVKGKLIVGTQLIEDTCPAGDRKLQNQNTKLNKAGTAVQLTDEANGTNKNLVALSKEQEVLLKGAKEGTIQSACVVEDGSVDVAATEASLQEKIEAAKEEAKEEVKETQEEVSEKIEEVKEETSEKVEEAKKELENEIKEVKEQKAEASTSTQTSQFDKSTYQIPM